MIIYNSLNRYIPSRLRYSFKLRRYSDKLADPINGSDNHYVDLSNSDTLIDTVPINTNKNLKSRFVDKNYIYTCDLNNDIDDYELSAYGTMYFTRKTVPRIIHYSKSLNQPITNVLSSEEPIALEIFKHIQNYMGNSKRWLSEVEDYLKYIDNIKDLMTKSENLIDETYCQLMNQLTDNQEEESREKGFEIFVALSCTINFYPPAHYLFGYIVRFLSRSAVKPGYAGSLAYYCLKLFIGLEKSTPFSVPLLSRLKEESLRDGIFNTRLSDVYSIEKKNQLLCQNGLLSNDMATYGSTAGIGRSYLVLSPYMKGDSIYNTLIYGGYILVLTDENGLKEKYVHMSSLLDSLIISTNGTWETTKTVISMRTFTKATINPDELIKPTDIIANASFAIVGNNKEDTIQFIASIIIFYN